MENCFSSRLKWRSLTGALSTEKYEKRQRRLHDNYKRFRSIAESEKLNTFLELQEYVHSEEFKRKKREITSLKYKGSEPHQKEQAYKKKAADRRFKDYFKMKGSEELAFYENHKDAEKLQRYLELKEYMASDRFKADKKHVEQARKEAIEKLQQKKKRYKSLKKQLKWFLKLEGSQDFNDFLHFKDSDTFRHFLELEEEVKNYSLSHLKKRLKADRKRYIKEKKALEKRFAALKKEAHKADKHKQPFEQQQELERIKETLAKGTLDQKIKDSDIKQSHEYIKIEEYRKLKKNSRVKKAARYYFSDKYKKYLEKKDVPEIAELKELEAFMSAEYKPLLKQARNKTYKNAEVYKWVREYKTLKKDPDIKRVLKTEKSKRFKNYQDLIDTAELKSFEELKAHVNSEEFKKRKAYLKDKKRFRKSEEYAKQQELRQLQKTEEVKFYLRHKDNKDFAELAGWELTFEETFSGNELATSWSSQPFLASGFIEGTFSQWHEDQCYTEENNHRVHGKLLIETKKEAMEGKAWHPQMGFVPKKFSTSSAMLHTGNSFKQKYGKFEVKARMDFATPLMHVIALSSGKQAPQIQLVMYGNQAKPNTFQVALFENNAGGNDLQRYECSLSGVNLSKDYHIFTVEWSEQRLEWKINGETIATRQKDIPAQELFWSVYSVKHNEKELSLNKAYLEVDWLRAYRQKAE